MPSMTMAMAGSTQDGAPVALPRRASTSTMPNHSITHADDNCKHCSNTFQRTGMMVPRTLSCQHVFCTGM